LVLCFIYPVPHPHPNSVSPSYVFLSPHQLICVLPFYHFFWKPCSSYPKQLSVLIGSDPLSVIAPAAGESAIVSSFHRGKPNNSVQPSLIFPRAPDKGSLFTLLLLTYLKYFSHKDEKHTRYPTPHIRRQWVLKVRDHPPPLSSLLRPPIATVNANKTSL
jgi:hypothetical protein